MIDAGILHEDEHVELIDGFLVGMTPQKSPHAYALQELNRLLIQSAGDAFAVRIQMPLTSALLVIEVSRSRLRYDRLIKARLYARYSIPEYWILNLKDSRIEVHRDPDPATETGPRSPPDRASRSRPRACPACRSTSPISSADPAQGS